MQLDFPGIAHYKIAGGEPLLEIDGRDFFLDLQVKSVQGKKPKDKKEALVQQETNERVLNKVKSHYHAKPALLLTG